MTSGAVRVFLWLGAGVLTVYGVVFLISPTVLGGLVGLGFEGPNAFVEIRAFYGGLELGLAGFLLWAAQRPAAAESALVAFACAFGAAGSARLAGIAEYGFAGPSQPVVAGIEIVGAAVALWLRRRVS